MSRQRRLTATKADIVAGMQQLPPSEVDSMRLAFDLFPRLEARGTVDAAIQSFGTSRNPIPRDKFVTVLSIMLVDDNPDRLREELRNLFNLVDVSKTGVITWEDFTAFCVDSAVQRSSANELAENLPRWELDREYIEDTAAHRPHKLKAIDSAGKVLCRDASGHFFFIDPFDNSGTKCEAPVLGRVLDGDYVPALDLYVLVTSGMEVAAYDATGNMTAVLNVEFSMTHCVWNPTLGRVCTGNRMGTLYTWNLARTQTGRPLRPTCATTHPLMRVAVLELMVHQAMGWLIAAFLDGTVIVLDADMNRCIHRFSASRLGLQCAALCEPQNVVLTGDADGTPLVWSMSARDVSKPFELHDSISPHYGELTGVAVVPNTSQGITMDASGCIKVWDIRSFKCLKTYHLRLRDKKVSWTSLTLMADHTIFCCDKKQIAVFHRLSEVDHHAASGPVVGVVYTHITERLVTASNTGMSAWDMRTGSLFADMPMLTHSEITTVCLDEDGSRVYAGTLSGVVYTFNSSTSRLTARFPKAHKSEVAAIAFIAHANLAISVDADGVGSVINPPKGASKRDLMSCGSGNAFRGMPGRMCVYLAGPLFFVAAADASCTIHLFDCRSIAVTGNVVPHSTVPFPHIGVAPSAQLDVTRALQLTAPSRGTTASASTRYGAMFVCDAETIGFWSLADRRDHKTKSLKTVASGSQSLSMSQRPVAEKIGFMRWPLDEKPTGIHITAIAVYTGMPSRLSAAAPCVVYVGDDAGRVTAFDLTKQIANLKKQTPEGNEVAEMVVQASVCQSVNSVACVPFASLVVVGAMEGCLVVLSPKLETIWSTKDSLRSPVPLLSRGHNWGTFKSGTPVTLITEATRRQSVTRKRSVVKGILSKIRQKRISEAPPIDPLALTTPQKNAEGEVLSPLSNMSQLSDEQLMTFQKRRHKQPPQSDPAWVHGQLEVLCGRFSAKHGTTESGEQIAYFTRNLNIPVVMDIDHGTDVQLATEECLVNDTRERRIVEDLTKDTRGEKRIHKARVREPWVSVNEYAYAERLRYNGALMRSNMLELREKVVRPAYEAPKLCPLRPLTDSDKDAAVTSMPFSKPQPSRAPRTTTAPQAMRGLSAAQQAPGWLLDRVNLSSAQRRRPASSMASSRKM